MKIRHVKLLVGIAGAGLGIRAAIRHKRRFDLAGKNVLITGGSRGLGLVLARQLIKRGARVGICARNLEQLDRARCELSASGGTVIAVQADLTDQNQVDLMVCSVRKALGPIDVLINNAGAISIGPIQTMDADDFNAAMRIHFFASLYATLSVLPDMRQRGGGRIVNISSIGGLVTVPHLAPYVASKFAMTGLSQSLRGELLRENIYVTSVYPGLMRTGSTSNATVKGNHKIEYAMFKLMASLPVATMSANRAAGQIIDAFMHGRANIILGVPAKAMAGFHALFPSISNDLSGFLNRVLPGAKKANRRAISGHEAESFLTRWPLGTLTDRAAAMNNQS